MGEGGLQLPYGALQLNLGNAPILKLRGKFRIAHHFNISFFHCMGKALLGYPNLSYFL
jgi:hypothetical protein